VNQEESFVAVGNLTSFTGRGQHSAGDSEAGLVC
jgi:hypothetical protein